MLTFIERITMAMDSNIQVERLEDDDHDLLTYGEVAARLDELLREGRAELATMQDEAATPDQIAAAEARISELEAAQARYQNHSASAAQFIATFGLTPRKPN